MALHRAGAIDDAARNYRQVLEQDPVNPDALHLLGLVAQQAGRLDEADDLITRALAQRPTNATFLFNLGIIKRAAGHLDQAIDCYRQAANHSPGNPMVHNNLGVALGETGDLIGAADCFREALRHAPQSTEAVLNLADTLQRTGLTAHLPEAEALARRAIALAPGLAQGYAVLAQSLPLPERRDEAVAAATQAARLAPDNAGYLELLAKLHQGGGDFEAAAEAARQAVELAPQSAPAKSLLGNCLLRLGKAGQAIPVLTEALSPGQRRQQECEAAAAAGLNAALLKRHRTTTAATLADLDGLVFPYHIAVPPGYDSVEAFNLELAQAIRQHATLKWNPPGYVTRQGAITENVLLSGQPIFEAMEWSIREAIERYTDTLEARRNHYFHRELKRRYRMVMWAVVLDQEGYLDTHIHENSWISGAYYVSIPAFARGPGHEHDGAIEFGRPPAQYGIEPPYPLRIVEPEEGMVVLFPSATYHATIPFQAPADRICISFNCQPY